MCCRGSATFAGGAAIVGSSVNGVTIVREAVGGFDGILATDFATALAWDKCGETFDEGELLSSHWLAIRADDCCKQVVHVRYRYFPSVSPL